MGSEMCIRDRALNITMTDDGRFNISTFTGDDSVLLDLAQATDHPRLHAVITEDGVKSDYICELSRRQDSWHLYYRGTSLCAHVRAPHIAALAHHMKPILKPDQSNMLLCPMPGSLMKLFVKAGDVVEAGQTLCIVEAMKMENALTAEKRCKIESLLAGEGDILSVDDTIMTFGDAD